MVLTFRNDAPNGDALARAYADAGIPPGVFNIMQGDGRVGQALSSRRHR